MGKPSDKRFWTSDLHFNHVNISEYCPLRKRLAVEFAWSGVNLTDEEVGRAYDNMVKDSSAVPAMNEALIANWNETVEPDDNVMILGDLCMGKLDESLALVPRLNGHKAIVPGNHDRCWEFAKNKTPEKAKEMKQKYKDVGLEIWPGQLLMQVGKHTVKVCHFPYRGDSHDEDRFQYARPFDEGHVLLCGHVHDSWTISDRQINVGVDVHSYRPISETLLLNLIEEVES